MAFSYFQIRYGSFADLEVLIDKETRELWVTNPTIEKLLGWRADSGREKYEAKSLKPYLSKDLAVGKSIGKLIKSKDITGRPNTSKAVPFDFARQVLVWDAVENKNPSAIKLLSAGFTDSFTSIAFEQAGIQVTLAERQEILEFYLKGYHEFFDWIRDQHTLIKGKAPESWYYAKINQMIDVVVCNKPNFNGDRKSNADKYDLRRIENFQMYFMQERARLYRNATPHAAVKDTLLEQYSNARNLIS